MPRAPGLYLHIPFCSAVCPYCDFSVLRAGVPARKRFVEHLVAEVALAARDWRDPRPFDTVYFGGGTPSLLPAEDLERVLGACRSHLALATPAPWIFLEANPEDVTPDACAAWRELGVRTLSLGVQSFSDEALRFLGRRHSAAQARAAVETAQAAGFDTVSVDLIFGLPDQTAEAWRRELAAAVALGPGHLSCYQLTIHPRTRFGVSAAAGPALRDARGRAGRSLRADAPRPRGRGLLRVRGLQLRARPRARVAPQPQVLGPHALPGLRPLGALARGRGRECPAGRPPLVERAAHPALGEPRGGGRAARRGRGVPRPDGAGDRGGDAGPAHQRPGSTSTASRRATGSTCWPRTTPSSPASWPRATSSCTPARKVAGGWCRRRPDWPSPTAWPPRSPSRSRAHSPGDTRLLTAKRTSRLTSVLRGRECT